MTDTVQGPVAVIDVGTNSVRVLVASLDDHGVLRIHMRRQWLTRLGQDVDRTGVLDPDAIRRKVDAVGDAVRIWQARHPGLDRDRIRITATSAARDAANAADFAAAVARVAGVAPEVIDGPEEAALAYRGASAGLVDDSSPTDRRLLVLDIGGGSTELIVGDSQMRTGTSRQLGSVRLTERHLHDDPPTAGQVADARRLVADEIAAGMRDIDVTTPVDATLVAVAGTATTVGAVALGLDGYDAGALHALVLSEDRVGEIAEGLLGAPVSDLAANPAVESGREDVIAGGALILHEAMCVLGAGHVTICTSDVLDGLALDLLSRT